MRYLTLDDDALTRREREAAGQTIHLTKAALDAFVNLAVRVCHIGILGRKDGDLLEVFEVIFSILIFSMFKDHVPISLINTLSPHI